MLEAGELALTEREQRRSSLPEHSTTIDVELEGEPFNAQWSGRSRQLTAMSSPSGSRTTARTAACCGCASSMVPIDSTCSARHRHADPFDVRAPTRSTCKIRSHARRASGAQPSTGSSTPTTNTTGALAAKRTIGFLTEARNAPRRTAQGSRFRSHVELVELRLQGEELATLDDFEELLAVDVANVERMPHQEAVARHALSRMRGRAVLADEVGLGKTIEAGLAVKELTLRGLAKRVLILCPAPLREQWREEMSHKFDLAFDVAYRGPEIANQDKLDTQPHAGHEQHRCSSPRSRGTSSSSTRPTVRRVRVRARGGS